MSSATKLLSAVPSGTKSASPSRININKSIRGGACGRFRQLTYW
ncbi:MAG: hypothetical protein ACM3UY_08800 [Methanocella sp.]